MRRLFLLVSILASFGLTACTKEIMAPVTEEKVELSPFMSSSIIASPGTTYGTQMSFYAPISVAPQIRYRIEETTAISPQLEVSTPRLEMVLDEACTPSCSRTAWRYTFFFTPYSVGEAIIYFYDQSNAEEEVPLKVIVQSWSGAKG